VDYFDINCHLETEQCINGRIPQLIRTINSALPEGEGSIHVLETIKGGVQQCAKKYIIFFYLKNFFKKNLDVLNMLLTNVVLLTLIN
jgi:hypothetical protein